MLSASAYSRRPFLGARLWQGTMQQTHACLRTFLTSFPTRHSSQLGPIPKSWTQYSMAVWQRLGFAKIIQFLLALNAYLVFAQFSKATLGWMFRGCPALICPLQATGCTGQVPHLQCTCAMESGQPFSASPYCSLSVPRTALT